MAKEPQPGDKIVVWVSCGAASAIAAKKTVEKYGKMCTVLLVNNPIKEEDEDNQRFLQDVETWIGGGYKIEHAINSKYKSCSCVEVWEDAQYMSGIDGAPCTVALKKQARYEWEIKNRPDWTVMGFTKEEKNRFNNFKAHERPATIHILNRTSKASCFRQILKAGLRLPRCYELGMPNANCKGCVKATSATYWNFIRRVYPEDFQQRAEQSRAIGVRLVRVKGKRIFLDELDPLAKGNRMKNLNFECGLFCGI